MTATSNAQPQFASFEELPVAGFGTISIRVFVLPTSSKSEDEQSEADLLEDLEPDEEPVFEKRKSPLSSYLETSRGKRCVVFLVNGQRQEFLDNSFIVQELGFKYLRSRMIIQIDVDGLAPEAIGQMMQGSRQSFYKGAAWNAMLKRIISTLKNDPDLERLEEEAEEQVAELKAGDDKVKQTLDQLINSHHDLGHDFAEGVGTSGDSAGADDLGFRTVANGDVVTLLPPDRGAPADYPVLVSQPGSTNIRLRPNQSREISVKSLPAGHWSALNNVVVSSDVSVPELVASVEKLADHGKISMLFTEPEGFDADQYPVRANITATASFNGIKDKRQLELSVFVKPDSPPVDPILLDDPTRLKVTSRLPVKLRMGEFDTHVKLRWDGKDSLLAGQSGRWRLSSRLLGSSASQPNYSFSEARAGRFSLLISPSKSWKEGDRLEFEVKASGPKNRTLLATFEAEVIAAVQPSTVEKVEKVPRLVDGQYAVGTNRRPPYDLKFIDKDNYDLPCWDADQWTDSDPGAFIEPTRGAPLTLIINNDMGALREFTKALTKRTTEQEVQKRTNKYTSHIAFHLYQMYQDSIDAQRETPKEEGVDAADARRREEIRRVALTMIRLMEVGR